MENSVHYVAVGASGFIHAVCHSYSDALGELMNCGEQGVVIETDKWRHWLSRMHAQEAISKEPAFVLH